MKTPLLSDRVRIVPVALALVASLSAQPSALGLIRLKNPTRLGDAPRLAAGQFSIDDLAAQGVGGASKGRKNNVDYLALDAGKEWIRPLHGPGLRTVSVSLAVLGSQSTVIEIGGARLGFTASLAEGDLQLMYDDTSGTEPQWRALGIYLPMEKHDGRWLGAAPLLTVQLEPDLGVWHLFAGARVVAYGLPLLPNADAKVSVKSGNDGAIICGLVQSDENPLFADSNANGIDDAFEKEQAGALLPGNSGVKQRAATVQAWKAAQKTKPAPALSYVRLAPDRT